MKIAIIGAGYAGLATAWHLLELLPHLSITLFDPQGYGGEASKISAGLLHKYAGLHAKLNRFGKEAENETHALLNVASDTFGGSVILSKGVLRLAFTEKQEIGYRQCAQQYEDVTWLESAECQELDPLLPDAPGIFIQSGISINTQAYLQGLFEACSAKGTQFYEKRILSLKDLDHFDLLICATGAASIHFSELDQLKIHPVKGQLIEIEWPAKIPPLPVSLVSQVYLCMNAESSRVIVGATYEHQFSDSAPDHKKAIAELYPRAIALYPALADAKVVDVKAGLRASTPSHLPFAGHVKGNLWALTGLGSRGLLYHAYFAKRLVQEIKQSLDKSF